MPKDYEMSKDEVDDKISEMNALALAENLTELREHYEVRLTALENDVASMRILIQKQSQVIGQALQNVMGHGSTEQDNG